MAAKLECEICGGKLVGKPGGVFECDSCGMEYSTEWARQKIQEIKGTVKVEGTVEVTGKVQVEGTSSRDSLLKRAKMCCADKDWGKAKELLEQVLNADPECAEAYLYRYLAAQKQSTPEALVADCCSHFEDFPSDPELEKAAQFADEALAVALNQYRQKCADVIEADKKHRQTCIGALAEKRKALEPAQHLIACDHSCTFGLRVDGTVITTGYDKVDTWQDVVAIVCDGCRFGLRADGTVVAAGYNSQGLCNVGAWRDVVAIACGGAHAAGLHRDGTVVAVGENLRGQCNVGDWREVTAIACGSFHTVGLRADGTVVAVGKNDYNQCEVGEWQNVVAITCGSKCTVGLCADGTVLATGGAKKEVSTWRNVVAIACTKGDIDDIFGLCSDGTVVTDVYGRCEVRAWRDVVAIACSDSHAVGLRADGTVLAAGLRGYGNKYGQCNVGAWRDVVAIACGGDYTVGLRSDGTAVAVGRNVYGQCNVDDWKLFHSVETLQQERVEAQERRKQETEKRREARKAALAQERAALQAELANLKGLFNGKRRKELEARLTEIDNEWKGLN